MKWLYDKDPLGPAHVLRWYGFHGEAYKSFSGQWQTLIEYWDDAGSLIEITLTDEFSSLKEAKSAVEKELDEYKNKILVSITGHKGA